MWLQFAIWLGFLLANGAISSAFHVSEPEEFVNLLTGTFGGPGDELHQKELSTGNTLPLVGMPWGFNYWAPQSNGRIRGKRSWWFDGGAHTFEGIRCTHQPSPWIGDYGWFLINPEAGEGTIGPQGKVPWVGYVSYKTATLKPYLMDLTLGPHGIRVELTPTNHGAIARFTFPASLAFKDRRVCVEVPQGDPGSFDELHAGKHEVTTGSCDPAVEGAEGIEVVSRRMAGGVPQNVSFALHAFLEVPGASIVRDGDRRCCVVVTGKRLEIRIGTSFISMSQAKRSLADEIGNGTFPECRNAARDMWHRMLARVEVTDAGPPAAATFRRLEVFYTCLYRAILFPRRLDENTAEGIQHWSPYDGHVHFGPGVTDHGFWDAFRTVYPLLALAYPRELGEILQGWLNAYKAGGWLPKWASPGYRGSMSGTFGDVVIADAILKNISGFDLDVAFAALWKDSFEKSPDGSFGKVGFKEYTTLGYVPLGVGVEDAMSETLDSAYADAACSAAFLKLGKTREGNTLKARSVRALQALYVKSSGLMGRIRQNRKLLDLRHSNSWGEGYTEGAAVHHSFPPFDLEALISLHGSRQQLLTRMQKVLNSPSDYVLGGHAGEIHEMKELQILAMGQYGHNNQVMHHFPYLFAALGDHNSTANLVRRTLSHAYSATAFSGDEDNGEMGAWHVLSALGLFSMAPGVTEEYVIGAMPLFRKTKLLELGIVIEAPSAPEEYPIVSEVRWQFQPVLHWHLQGRGSEQSGHHSLAYSALRQGGVLHFASLADAAMESQTEGSCSANCTS